MKMRWGMRLTLVLSTVLLLVLLAACAKKAPPTSTPSAAENPSAAAPSTGWTPEAPTPSLSVESSADAFNKQGVLKRIHFDTDKWAIRPEDREILKQNAAWLLAHPQFQVIVEGNCDERNTEAYNLALGERRANAAKEYLIGLGVAASHIQTVSYGKSHPLCTEHTPECWQINRRDDFVLQDMK
ncbi:MAG: peptidoglycan-associated lipoprotein Pal [Acidobacteriota bacterium]